ncbi:GntR family transcriptional regulator, partial [Streptococcus pneumoniae]|uniref:GntR family transcriptional regulator n=1 Tax=Streptococcus pneumoniae TaxID=1313 RepID=UPI000A97371E
MSWTFDNKKPIYLQIMEKIKLQIVSHTLEPNQQLPTVRELASEAGVNPNTIQRALSPNHSYLSQLDVTYKTPDLMSHFLPPHEVS